MIITHYGGECFKMQTGDTVIAFNPPSKESKLKSPRFGADVVLISLNEKDFNGIENVSPAGKESFVISGPGEYEVKNIFIKGFLTETNYGGKKMINTVYSVLFDGIKICFLGALGNILSLSSEMKGELDSHDLLFVPIGGGDVLSYVDASKLSGSLGAKVIIPTHYEGIGDASAISNFLKEEGIGKLDTIEKLTIKKKEFEEKDGEIVLLSAL